jgi:maltose alpha-D-glucosyltransferase/alpha-amylase
VANLSRQAQAVEIDLSAFQGRVPVEMTGASPFPPIGELPYLLTLPAYGFFWFELSQDGAPAWHTPYTGVLPDFLTLTTRDGRIATALDDPVARQFESQALCEYLPLQRWFAAKGQRLERVDLRRLAELADGRHLMSVADVTLRDGEAQRYFLPLSVEWGEEALGMGPRLPATLAKLRRANQVGALVDGVVDEHLAQTLLDAMKEGATVEAGDGRIEFRGTDPLRGIKAPGEPRLLSAEQSNASIAFSDRLILKLYRRLREGVQPDIEVARFLTEETDFAASPALLGTIDWVEGDGTRTTLAAASEYVGNQGDAWTYVTEALERDMERQETAAPEEMPEDPLMGGGPLDIGAVLGRRTAEMHLALASGGPGTGFSAEELTRDDLAAMADEAMAELGASLDRLEAEKGALAEADRDLAERLLARRGRLGERIAALKGHAPSGGRCRIHGDYHLGQVLVAETDVVIIDFEGEPTRPLSERTAKTSPLRDVAGMLRSFDYALWTTARRRLDLGADPEATMLGVETWRDATQGTFLDAYRETMDGAPLHPADPALERDLLDTFLIRKAAYEVAYEMAMRPDWIDIPLRGLLALVGETGGSE